MEGFKIEFERWMLNKRIYNFWIPSTTPTGSHFLMSNRCYESEIIVTFFSCRNVYENEEKSKTLAHVYVQLQDQWIGPLYICAHTHAYANT